MSIKALAAGLFGFLAVDFVGNKLIDKAEGVSSEQLADAITPRQADRRPVASPPHVSGQCVRGRFRVRVGQETVKGRPR